MQTKNKKVVLLGALGVGAALILSSQSKTGQKLLNDFENMAIPKGIRNNNPTNLRDSSSKWVGKVGVDKTGFVRFSDMDFGIRAGVLNMLTAINKHKCTSVRKLIARWAPPSENNTQAYIAAVTKSARISADETINISDAYTVAAIMSAIIDHENGQKPAAQAGINTIRVQEVINKYKLVTPKNA